MNSKVNKGWGVFTLLFASLSLTACGGGGGGDDGGGTPTPQPTPTGDNTPPTTKIERPSDGSMITETVTIEGTAVEETGGSGLDRVFLYIDDTEVAEFTTSSYQFEWTITAADDGARQIRVEAFDTAGNSASDAVSVTVSYDGDGDGVPDVDDNCPTTYNPGQEDSDGDDLGDVCDSDVTNPDSDGDGAPDGADNCPVVFNPNQANFDGDTEGDACDDDDDNDSVPDSEDAFPLNSNESLDSDGDGVGDNSDICPSTVNPGQEDSDGDGVGDVCDNCPSTANPGQEDSDGDDVGDMCETDGPYTLHSIECSSCVARANSYATTEHVFVAEVSRGNAERFTLNYFTDRFGTGGGPNNYVAVDMYDDGTGADEVAGDERFTGVLTLNQEPTQRLYGSSMDFQKVTVSAFDSDGNFLVSQPRISPDWPVVAVGEHVPSCIPTQLAEGVSVCGDVINVVLDSFSGWNSLPALMRTVYQHVDDRYMYSVVTSHGKTTGDGIPRGITVKNDVVGIDCPIIDLSSSYGSATLRHIAYMNNNINGQGIVHEIIHGVVCTGAFDNQALNLKLGGGDDYHFGANSLLNGQLRTGPYLEEQTDDTLLPVSVDGGLSCHNPASELELYLSGYDNFSPFNAVTDPTVQVNYGVPLEVGDYSEVPQTLFVQVYGARIPAVGSAPNHINVLYVAVSMEPLSEAAWALENLKASHLESEASGRLTTSGWPTCDPVSLTRYLHNRATVSTELVLR